MGVEVTAARIYTTKYIPAGEKHHLQLTSTKTGHFEFDKMSQRKIPSSFGNQSLLINACFLVEIEPL